MMKKPLNMTIRAEPTVGRVGALVRHDEHRQAEHDGPADEQEREQELRVGHPHPAAQEGRPTLGGRRRSQEDEDHQGGDGDRDGERDVTPGSWRTAPGATARDGLRSGRW